MSTGKSLPEELKATFDPNEIGKIVIQLDKAASTMLNQFGQAEAMAGTLRKSLSDSVQGVLKLGGDIDTVLKTQLAVSEGLGRNIILSAKASKDLYASFLVTGQEVGKIVTGMADVGISSTNATKEMKKVVDIARESGVNAQMVSGKVLENMQALNKYNFEGGVQGLAKMAAQATALRIDMSQTLEFAEKVFNPEGAIEIAAAMQRLGVAQSDLLDPLRLMDLSQNDPAELQNQITQMSKQFVQMGKDGHFEIMPGAKRQLREISTAMGISYDQLTKMALGSSDLDKKMKEISFPSMTEDQKTMIANMAEMGEGGTYQIKTVAGETKDVSALSELEITALEKMANTAPKTMEEMAKQQLNAVDSIMGDVRSITQSIGLGIAGSKTTNEVLGLAKDSVSALTRLVPPSLSPESIGSSIDKAVSGNLSMGDFVSYLKNDLKGSFVNAQVEIDKLTQKYSILGNLFGSPTPTVQAQDMLKLPGQNVELLPQDTFAAFTKGSEVLSNLGNRNNTSTTTPTSTNSTVDVNHTLNININAPSHINTNQLVEMFKDTGVSQALGVAAKEAFNNGGLTAPTSNKQKLLNPTINPYV